MIKVIALLACLFVPLSLHAQQPSQDPLSNTAVIKLVKAGFKEKTIIAIIHSRPNRFKLDPEQLIELKRGGVSENIILAMLSQDQSFSMSDDEMSDDEAFFRASTAPPNGSQIFGSGSGSRSESKSRGIRGGNNSEGNVTGSATVRILRPTETDGPAKLERTPTLNNEEVIRLVEAGFSEGTIIKRIESSPVSFDLSPAKVEELQKRRVSDAIIAAMTEAMGDTPKKPSEPQVP